MCWCVGRYARKGDIAKLEARRARCQDRFERRAARNVNRYGEANCTSVALSTLEADVTQFVETISSKAGGTPAPESPSTDPWNVIRYPENMECDQESLRIP